MTTRSRTIAAVFSLVFVLSIARTTTARKFSATREKDNEAQQALAQAEALRVNWTETSVRQSAEQFDKAASIWRSLGDFSNASRATIKSGDAYFDLSQYREAHQRYQNAVVLAVKKQDWLSEARALTKLTRVEIYFGDNDLARKNITRAVDLLIRDQRNVTPDAKNAYGETLTSFGELAYARGNFKKALTHFEGALKFLDDQNGQARAHLFTGYIWGSIGNLDKALAEISVARQLYQATNNKAGEGQALTAIGLVHSQQGDHNGAITLHNNASEIFRTIGDRHSEAMASNALGQAYELLNESALALNYYKQALRLFQAVGAVNGVAPTNCLIAGMYNRGHDPDEALKYYERCLNLSRTAGMARHEVHALTEIANLYVAQQRFALALAEHQRIQKFYERMGDRRGLETALTLYGNLLLQTGQTKEAADAFERALSLTEQIGDKETQILMLSNLARTNLVLSGPEVALPFIQRCLKLIEELRSNVASPEFRTSYFSGVQQHYELCIEILAQLNQLHPGKGFDAEALLVYEKSRARLLLDLVNESRAKIREGASKELIDKETELRALIRAQAAYKMELPSNQKDPAELAEAENQLNDLKAQYQQVEAQVRQQNPYLSSLEQLAPLSVEQIRKELRDTDSILLEYSLGEKRSFLWAVTSQSMEMFELPERKSIEDAAREFYELLTMRQRLVGSSDYRVRIEEAEKRLPEITNALSHILLGQVAGRLGNKRLVLVVEGALQYVPFSALPLPVNQNVGRQTLLLETNEIVTQPSFSALLAIRNNRPKHVISPNKLVAVIADPVLSRNDDRVQGQPATALASTDKTQTPETVTRDGLTRLAHASEEADAIYGVAPWSTTMMAKGFDASRETAMSPNVGQYQIVHFATHGFVDTEHPELSGIVLTMVDRNGAKTDGLMPLHDIYSLDLSAELTVLSACQTAIGKDIKGEGFVGLSHAFMSAGSKSVVASLWKVDDRATSDLMRDFYDAMLKQGMSPAAALRSAQLKMLRDNGRSAPYYWAGFVLQGEYTNRIAVDHHSLLGVALVLLFLLSLVTAGVLVFQKRRRRISPTQST